MMAAERTPYLEDRLPAVRGSYTPMAPLAPMTWFRVGGPAEVLYEPADQADLTQFLKQKDADIPVTVIGLASNALVRDGGIPGVVIRLGKAFGQIEISGHEVTCGAGAADAAVASKAAEAGIAGLEFLTGIPGSMGGALRMNAGAYGREMCDILTGATALDPQGREQKLSLADMDFTYRHCGVDEAWIFTSATLKGVGDEPDAIRARMAEIRTERADAQPTKSRTGGSTFANPPEAKAWKLIDEAGCRGLMVGGAQVSEKHCNFLINTGSATATDLEALGEKVRVAVMKNAGIPLVWEIRRLGVPLGHPDALVMGASS